MNKPELYQRTVDILVQAYFNDTLQHSNCQACAVGNMVAANKGITLKRELDRGVTSSHSYTQWFHAIGGGIFFPWNVCAEVAEEIKATGYTGEELAVIEYAFETTPQIKNVDERMFQGLCRVIDALDIIHGNTDATITTSSKQKFNKQLVKL